MITRPCSHTRVQRARRAAPTIRSQLKVLDQHALKQAASSTGTAALLEPLQIGPYELQHRIVMAPLTRCR